MKNVLKKMLAIAAVAISASACATPINVGGVVWDPDRPANPKDFSANTSSIVQFQNEVGGIHGYGLLDAINGISSENVYCPGCQLAFTYGGFTLLPGQPNLVLERKYSGGWANVYVMTGSNIISDINDATEAGIESNGQLFLTLLGHEIPGQIAPGVSLTGLSTIDGGILSKATGQGQYDVADNLGAGGDGVGLANAYFDTNSMVDGSDFTSTISFTSFDIPHASAFGAGTFTGDSMNIPEPGSLALMGIGMLGLIGTRKKIGK